MTNTLIEYLQQAHKPYIYAVQATQHVVFSIIRVEWAVMAAANRCDLSGGE